MELVISQHELGAPSASDTIEPNFDEEIAWILLPLTQRSPEVDDATVKAEDLAFLEAIAIGLKDAQERYSRRWGKIQEERKAADLVDWKLRDKANELRTWYNKRIHELIEQEEKIAAAREVAATRDSKLMKREVLLNARVKDIAAREQALASILHGKDDEI